MRTKCLGSVELQRRTAGASHPSLLHLLHLHVIIWNCRRAKSYRKSLWKHHRQHIKSPFTSITVSRSQWRVPHVKHTRSFVWWDWKCRWTAAKTKHTAGRSHGPKVRSFSTPLAEVSGESDWTVSLGERDIMLVKRSTFNLKYSHCLWISVFITNANSPNHCKAHDSTGLATVFCCY